MANRLEVRFRPRRVHSVWRNIRSRGELLSFGLWPPLPWLAAIGAVNPGNGLPFDAWLCAGSRRRQTRGRILGFRRAYRTP